MRRNAAQLIALGAAATLVTANFAHGAEGSPKSNSDTLISLGSAVAIPWRDVRHFGSFQQDVFILIRSSRIRAATPSLK